MLQYRRRDNFLDKVERVYQISGGCITEIRPHKTTEIMFADVVEFRLCYLPTAEKPNRYMVTVKNTKGECIQFDNMHHRAKGGLEERSQAYRDFVSVLIDELRSAQPNLIVRSGGARWYYALRLAGGLTVFTTVIAGLIFIPMPDGWMSPAGLIKVGALVVLLPLLLRWVVKIKPKIYPIADLPDRVLPSATVMA